MATVMETTTAIKPMGTPSLASVIKEDLPTGAIVGIVLGGICFLALVWCMTYWCRMFFHYSAKDGTRSDGIFFAEETGCCNQICVDVNTRALQCCCSWINDDLIKARPLHRPTNNIHVGAPNAAHTMTNFQDNWSHRIEENYALLAPRHFQMSDHLRL